MKRTIEERLLNPKPGSKIAAAKEFGIDLTLLIKNLRLTPQNRIKQLDLFEKNVFKVFDSLLKNNVEFVVVGEIACLIHGWKTITQTVEICYLKTVKNLKLLNTALVSFNTESKAFSENFTLEDQTIQNRTNFKFETDIGNIDLLDEVNGVGSYKDVLRNSEIRQLFGIQIRVLTLDALISAKRAAGRTKDLLVLPELEALRELLTDEDE